jgi:DNA-binding MarR family transcriptional regulator
VNVKDREFQVLDAISKDSTVTQANLATSLEMAVGSVNWYIKRLISRGYLKASRMDRTRLQYNLTPEGMAALTKRATQYMISSLQVYRQLRESAKLLISELHNKEIRQVFLTGSDEFMDIFRLSCIEAGIKVEPIPTKWVVKNEGYNYLLEHIEEHH